MAWGTVGPSVSLHDSVEGPQARTIMAASGTTLLPHGSVCDDSPSCGIERDRRRAQPWYGPHPGSDCFGGVVGRVVWMRACPPVRTMGLQASRRRHATEESALGSGKSHVTAAKGRCEWAGDGMNPCHEPMA